MLTTIFATTTILLQASSGFSSPLAISSAAALTQNDPAYYRLPTAVKPTNYRIQLIPYIDEQHNFTFDGRVWIYVTVEENTSNITLHANDMEIWNVTLMKNNVLLNITYTYSEDDRHFVVIQPADGGQFKLGKNYIIEISYTGHFRDDMRGFYRSSYLDENGNLRWLVVSKFEPTYARRAFPCFDEPALKAYFYLSISVPKGYSAISNMEALDVSPHEMTKDENRTWFHFERSVLMPTYLVAFLVSDFGNVSTNSSAPLHVWARKGALMDAAYSAQISPRVLEALIKFVNNPYQLKKMDEVALPDYVSGATENWGMVAYRERLQLYNKEKTDAYSKQRIATVIAHEFSHQWFGNLVSPEWWDYLWLNEGFATYFEFFIIDKMEPNWRLKEQFVIREVQSALSADSTVDSHPVTATVGSPSEVQGIFDSISYSKAGALIWMMENFLTSEVFRRGLNMYLSKRPYSTANPEALFSVLDAEFQKINGYVPYQNVTEMMQKWTLQTGYPVLTVSIDLENKLYKLEQKRFLVQNPGNAEEYIWSIPVTFTTIDNYDAYVNTTTKFWMTEKETNFSYDAVGRNLIFNVLQSGFYRVNYDAFLWKEIQYWLTRTSYIHPVNKAQLLDDAFALARAEELNYTTAMDLTTYLVHEVDYIPWYSALKALSFIDTRLYGTQYYATFQRYMMHLLENIYNHVGFEEASDDSHLIKLLRTLILTTACNLDHEDCVNNATSKFKEFMTKGEAAAIPPDLQGPVYCTAIRKGTSTEWNFLWQTYKRSNVATEESTILAALGCTNDPTLIKQYLKTSITDSLHIRRQDAVSVFSAVYSTKGNVETALDFLQKNYDLIREYYASASSSVGTVTAGIAAQITTEKQYKMYEDFSAKLQAEGNSTTKLLETIQQNLKWTAKFGPTFTEWINKEVPVPDTGHGSSNSAVPNMCFLILLVTFNIILKYQFQWHLH